MDKLKVISLISVFLGLCSIAFAGISAETYMSSHIMASGENRTYNLFVRDFQGDVSVDFSGEISNIVEVFPIEESEEMKVYEIRANAPNLSIERTFSGSMIVSDEVSSEDFPVSISIIPEYGIEKNLNVGFISDTIDVEENPAIHINIEAYEPLNEIYDINFTLIESETGETVKNFNESFFVEETFSEIITINLSGKELSTGFYYIEAVMELEDQHISSLDTIEFIRPFWTPTRMRISLFLVVSIAFVVGSVKLYNWYQDKKDEEARYVFPVDYNMLPSEEDTFWVGKVAETSKEAYVDPADLTTHGIVAGSTGSGKSVTASVIVEEALEQDIPVVVFDPTAQWTGFVEKCSDENLLEHYERFDMDPEDDPKPYKGLIKKLDSDNPKVDFENLMNPGEVTVFTLSHLTTEEFDDVVREIIDSMFEVEWEESMTLELLVVFDEVHRLLEEYGGKGGYHALERGAREFRKWGIGLIMASQVTADFKQAVSGNIMTEVQMQTKSMEDINRVKKKYGDQFARRITSEEVGTGMIQNSQYNDGDPWFVDFRPTYHNPHKIKDSQLEKYYDFSERLDKLRKIVEDRKDKGEDVYEDELELRLASDKLKEGRFRMAEMYINTLEDRIK